MLSRVEIFWFRRDLRLEDNAGLYHALRSEGPVLPLFIFDRNILDGLENKADRRVEFIQAALVHLEKKLVGMGSSLVVRVGRPVEVFPALLTEFEVTGVWVNTDYEPYAKERDGAVRELLTGHGIPFHSIKDQVIFDTDEVVKENGEPYTVFTPYSRKWRAKLNEGALSSYPTAKYWSNFISRTAVLSQEVAAVPSSLEAVAVPSLEALGFVRTGGPFPRAVIGPDVLRNYAGLRDLPAVVGTSRVGVHLRHGTISIRELGRRAVRESQVFLSELIWRDFFQLILWHFPAVGMGRAFKPAYDRIQWRNNEEEFERWCKGQTGYPLVDAGMRELNATGFMHNRVRMVTASFLSKHLLIDWRWGEAYFAEKLLDFDLAANNGNWQWAAGCGCDAAPYFRVFNPIAQAKRYDPQGLYIRRWVPESEGVVVGVGVGVEPIVDHGMARKRALEVYRRALNGE